MLPVHNIGQQVIVFETVVNINLLIVYSQRSCTNAPLLEKNHTDMLKIGRPLNKILIFILKFVTMMNQLADS
jgi:hypothetical protein